jgi:hypothetical protein
MSNDINLAKNTSSIRNGTLVTSCLPTGRFSLSYNSAVTHPVIANIESKYDIRFDNPSYYYGGGLSDGGTYGGDVDGGEL